ncbi:hypothetical protein COHA_004086 [Chlorella ohadii]|uniref:Uncharacterized protein n=1 Tax=Chlorella ohadii TaxID=2649997 RepID=A0AAD5DQM5_9CHLO|nr:hypothetical protein COHA_004086 [Chlorella ohadii]
MHTSVLPTRFQTRCQQEVNLSDAANVLHSPGLLSFAASAGLCRSTACDPFSWFDAFMSNNAGDQVYSTPRVRDLQRLLNGTRNRGVALGYEGHVVQLRPPGSVPDALSATLYIAMAMPALSPFVPIYKGLPGDALPPALAFRAGRRPDNTSLVWKARRLQALVVQDWPRLVPPAQAAIYAFERHMVHRQQPAFERRYMELHRSGREAAAAAQLARFTKHVVAQACALLDRLAAEAAEALGFEDGLPPDDVLSSALDWQSRLWFPPR